MRISGALIAAFLMISPALAQASWKAPRTTHGAPDLEGVWNTLTATPLERPPGFDSLTTTEARAAQFEKAGAAAFLADASDGVGGRQSEWWEIGEHMLRINGEIRTSAIVDPPDGKLPYSDKGRALLADRMRAQLADFDGPEIRPSPERCLTGGSGSTGTPIFFARYNANYQIVQTADYVVIWMEQNRDMRIIRLGAAHHLPAGMTQWMGDSIGHWEGDTLVVETVGFKPGDAFKPAAPIYVSENARVTERFTRIAPDQLLYQYTVEDPVAFSRTWRAETIFRSTNNRMFEYACHEGNYSLPHILSGGRELDRRKAKAKP